MILVYGMWYYNNLLYTACAYYVKPVVMTLVDKYGSTVGLTVLNVARRGF